MSNGGSTFDLDHRSPSYLVYKNVRQKLRAVQGSVDEGDLIRLFELASAEVPAIEFGSMSRQEHRSRLKTRRRRARFSPFSQWSERLHELSVIRGQEVVGSEPESYAVG